MKYTVVRAFFVMEVGHAVISAQPAHALISRE